jgi:hypothetical protein
MSPEKTSAVNALLRLRKLQLRQRKNRMMP